MATKKLNSADYTGECEGQTVDQCPLLRYMVDANIAENTPFLNMNTGEATTHLTLFSPKRSNPWVRMNHCPVCGKEIKPEPEPPLEERIEKLATEAERVSKP